MEYTEILRLQAKTMLAQLARESGNKAYEDERLLECMHGAFCIIRNDTRAQVIADQLIGEGIHFTIGSDVEKAQWLALVRSYIATYAKTRSIPMMVISEGTT